VEAPGRATRSHPQAPTDAQLAPTEEHWQLDIWAQISILPELTARKKKRHIVPNNAHLRGAFSFETKERRRAWANQELGHQKYFFRSLRQRSLLAAP
jgi:hypothetical protein